MAKSHAGRFSYRILAPEKGDIPFGAIVHIIPRSYTSDEEKWPLLSPDLMTEKEIDWHIQAYKADLDRIGRVAKRALKRANRRTLRRLQKQSK